MLAIYVSGFDGCTLFNNCFLVSAKVLDMSHTLLYCAANFQGISTARHASRQRMQHLRRFVRFLPFPEVRSKFKQGSITPFRTNLSRVITTLQFSTIVITLRGNVHFVWSLRLLLICYHMLILRTNTTMRQSVNP